MAKSPTTISAFDAVTTTSMEILAYGTDLPTGAFITGHTPDSPEWRAAQRQKAATSRPQRLMLAKKANYIELEKPKGEHSDEDLMLIDMITDISGIPDYKFTPESAKENLLGKWYHILSQWRDHLDDRQNFLANVGKSVNDG